MDDANISVRRATLQSRLAAERANFFYQIRGLDEETLCATPIVESWTVRDMLPHLGYWDAVYADRMQRVLDGRRAEIQPIDGEDALDRINAEARYQFAHLNLAEAVAVAVKERNGFLATLAQAEDDLLFRRIQLAPGWRTSMSTWTRWRYRHDADHAATLTRWRQKGRGMRVTDAPAGKVILRPFLSAARWEFMSIASLVSPTECNTRPLCGAWTLRDILGHLTLHESMGVTALRDLAAGELPLFSKTIRNFNTFNEAQVLARQKIGWAQTLDDYYAIRKALVTLIDNLANAELMRPFTAPWGTPITGYQYVFGLAIHEQEHAAILRSALRLRPLPKRLRHFRTV